MGRRAYVIAGGGRRGHQRQTRWKVPRALIADYRRCAETGKVQHATKADALDMAEQMMDQGQVSPGCHQTPYLCAACRSWHVGSRRIVAAR